MSANEDVSERLVAQRVRNRIMEELLRLCEGNDGVQQVGATEWFESFFDHFPYEGEPSWYPAMTPEEANAVRTVCKLMQQAISDASISKSPTVAEVITSGWPDRIAPFAKKALDLMLVRGRFSEEKEEDQPSSPVAGP